MSNSAAVAVVNRAEKIRRNGSYAEARKLLENARPCIPEGHLAHAALVNNLAQIYKLTGPKKEVQPLLEAALRAWQGSPYYANGLANLADWHQSRRQFRQAELLYRKALALAPYEPLHHSNLGWLLHQTKRYDEAEHCYRWALELYEGSGQRSAMQTWGSLGWLLTERNKDDEAMAAFQRMLEFVPPIPADENAMAVYMECYARLLRRRNEPAAAEQAGAVAMRYRVRSAFRQSAARSSGS